MARAITRLQSSLKNLWPGGGGVRTLTGPAFEQQMVLSSTSSRNPSTSPQRSTSTNAATSKDNLPSEAVFYHPKHDMYVCWHPEVPFPYEMSKPIPAEAAVTNSTLKIQSLMPVKEIFRKKNQRLMVRELMKLTYTTKYGWLGQHGRKKRYVIRDMDPLKQRRDREFL